MRYVPAVAVLFAIGMALAPVAFSDEADIHIKPGRGADLVEAHCAVCHSLDYIQMNSPFLDEKGWSNEVTKMVKAFGAPIDEADQREIIAYLAASYGKPPG